jgi:hypothetical protein
LSHLTVDSTNTDKVPWIPATHHSSSPPPFHRNVLGTLSWLRRGSAPSDATSCNNSCSSNIPSSSVRVLFFSTALGEALLLLLRLSINESLHLFTTFDRLCTCTFLSFVNLSLLRPSFRLSRPHEGIGSAFPPIFSSFGYSANGDWRFVLFACLNDLYGWLVEGLGRRMEWLL